MTTVAGATTIFALTLAVISIMSLFFMARKYEKLAAMYKRVMIRERELEQDIWKLRSDVRKNNPEKEIELIV